MRLRLIVGLIAVLCLATLAGSADALTVSVSYDSGTTQVTSGLTGYSTYGDDMDGMGVTARFDDASSETVYWADTGLGAGAASGTNWSLSESGDTFGSDWSLTNSTGQSMTSLFIDAGLGDTVYDIDTGDYGTTGSALGWTFEATGGSTDLAITATYIDAVMLDGSSGPVGDLWRCLDIAFTNSEGFYHGASLTYITDTDNLELAGDIRPIPEPTSVLLLGVGLIGLAGKRLRKRS